MSRGFSLIETLVTVSLFAVVLGMVFNLFVLLSSSSQRMSASSRLEADARAILNQMTERVKISIVDYSFYENKTISNPEGILALKNRFGESSLFSQNTEVCLTPDSTPCLAFSSDGGITWKPISSPETQVENLSFYIFPQNEDPKTLANEVILSLSLISAKKNIKVGRPKLTVQTTINTRN